MVSYYGDCRFVEEDLNFSPSKSCAFPNFTVSPRVKLEAACAVCFNAETDGCVVTIVHLIIKEIYVFNYIYPIPVFPVPCTYSHSVNHNKSALNLQDRYKKEKDTR